MKILILTFSTAISISSFGQFNFKPSHEISKRVEFVADVKGKNFVNGMDRMLDSVFQLDKNFDFEFRYWETGLIVNSTKVLILAQRNKKWSARYFYYNKDWQKDGKSLAEAQVDQSKLDQLWELLVHNNVLTLPSQDSLKNRMVKYVIDTAFLGFGHEEHFEIDDGILYEFELSKPEKKRVYWYGCPQLLLKQYGNIEELFNAVELILLIQRYLGLDETGC